MQTEFNFTGADFNKERDQKRLDSQIGKILRLMLDGVWRTVNEISSMVGCPENSAQAQLRNLRKKPNGGYTVDRRYMGNGLYQYRVSK